ncbi:hypothetical protein K4043_01695 [Stenotrophomonas sp. SRS1]|uniref:hypothetical protein n=1 Tax=Stenotrophomonas sp. SRS1 TaxID=2870345 RepID=UPI002237DAD2|nr:hypothetical protein [Stenotrophomonas sp. SRS1]MCW6026722.1 hypothetical protein [Stenotrophomonas sp. SRS1]
MCKECKDCPELSQGLRAHIEALGKGSVVTEAGIREAGEDSFVCHLRGLARRVTNGFKNAQTALVRVHLTEGTGKANAFAYAKIEGRPNRHLVLVTRELLNRVRTLAGQTPSIAKLISERAAPSDVLRTLWGDLPNDEDHYEAFGALLANVALGFLINHEMAHIAFQHVTILGEESCSSFEIDEVASILGQGAATNHSHCKELRSQTIELDADVHGLNWTRIYLEELAERILRTSVIHDPTAEAVWRNFVGTEAGRRFLLVSSSWLLLLSFPPSGFKLKDMEKGTHPALSIRLCTLLHAEAEIAKQKNNCKQQDRQVAASIFALLAYAGAQAAENAIEKFSQGSSIDTPSQEYSLQKAARDWGIYQTLGQEGAVQAHLQRLASERRSMEKKIGSGKICSDDAVLRWFMEERPMGSGVEVSTTESVMAPVVASR